MGQRLCQVGTFIKRRSTDDGLDWRNPCLEEASNTPPFASLCRAHGDGMTAALQAHSVDPAKASSLMPSETPQDQR